MDRHSIRTRRVAENIKRILAPIVAQHARDHGLGMVTLTDVEVSADLKSAVLYVSRFGSQADHHKVVDSFGPQIGQLRSLLAQSLKIRSVPELRVRYDDTQERSARIDALLSRQ